MAINNKKGFGNRKAELQMRFSEFDIPPIQDFLLIGRRAPIGPEAVRRMVDALAPGQYEIILLKDTHVEAVAVKTTLFKLIPRDVLLDTILDEAIKISDERSLVKAKLDITISIIKEVGI